MYRPYALSMETTVRLSDSLVEEVKRYAAERNKTFAQVVEEALREKLTRHEKTEKRSPSSSSHTTGEAFNPASTWTTLLLCLTLWTGSNNFICC